jgi:hypothetical protein
MLQAILCCEFQSRPQNKCVPTKLYLFIKYTILLQIIFTVFKTQSTKGNFVTINKIYNKQQKHVLSQIFNLCPERRKRDAAARAETTIFPPILVSIIEIILVLPYNLIP